MEEQNKLLMQMNQTMIAQNKCLSAQNEHLAALLEMQAVEIQHQSEKIICLLERFRDAKEDILRFVAGCKTMRENGASGSAK